MLLSCDDFGVVRLRGMGRFRKKRGLGLAFPRKAYFTQGLLSQCRAGAFGLDFFDLSGGEEFLVVVPGHGGFAGGDLVHGNAAFDGAGEGAHVAADAGVSFDREEVDGGGGFGGVGGA
jgi:hypothetical protein